jgi:predicted transcriptional regulator
MSERKELEINEDEFDWARARVQEGRPHGTVVSVRLDPDEAARLRELASTLGLNMSQVLRQALAQFPPRREGLLLAWRAWTSGGVDWVREVERPSDATSTELRPRIRETVSG